MPVLRIIIRQMTTLILMACGIAPVAALAEDTTCRGGLFTRQASFAQATVTQPQAFFHTDTDGCPTSGQCRTNSYVIDGDALVIGRRIGDFVCAFFPNDSGGTAGWVETGALQIDPLDTAPTPAHWDGNWTDGGSADLTIRAKDGSPYIVGEAFWPARPEENDWPTIHIGEVDGRLSITGNRASYSDDNLCELELTLLRDFLLVADNRRCGGVNVTFSGVYTRGG